MSAEEKALIYTDTPQALAKLMHGLRGCSRVAIDTEADSLHHYYEKVCLIQLGLNGEQYLLDPLAELELGPFFLELAGHPLVLHGADYDLHMLRSSFDFEPGAGIFDTMLAAQLLGFEQLGLAALVEKYFGLVLPKEGQKFDWSRRPLPEKMLAYAANDTRYLLRLADTLEAELREKGRLDWHREACRRAIETSRLDKPRDEERCWRVKGAHALDARGLAVLRALWYWRDRAAARADLPAFKVLANPKLLELSQWALKNPQLPMDQLPRLPRNFREKRIHSMLKDMEKALNAPEEQLPPKKAPRRGPAGLAREDEALTRKLLAVRDKTAERLELPKGVLGSRATITLISRRRPESLTGIAEAGNLHDWQLELLGSEFLEVLREK